MREEIDGDILFNDLMMTRQMDSSLVLLLEGDEDAAVVDCHINDQRCRSETGNGKQNILRVVELAVENGVEWIFFALDRDFDSQATLKALHARMSVSDAYDMHSEILIKCEKAMKHIVIAHGRRAHLLAYGDHARIRAAVLEVSSTLGALRYVSSKFGLKLKLAKFPIQDLIKHYESGNLAEEVIRIAVARSSIVLIKPSHILSLINSHHGTMFPVEYFCQGHDMVTFFSVIIRQRLGGTIGERVLAESIQCSVTRDCFSKLSIFKDFDDWGKDIGVDVWVAA